MLDPAFGDLMTPDKRKLELGFMGDTTIVATVLAALIATGFALFFTYHFNLKDSTLRKLIKFLGILISTVPIIGIVQGAVAARFNAEGYSSACFWQAAVGAVIYAVGSYVIKLFSQS